MEEDAVNRQREAVGPTGEAERRRSELIEDDDVIAEILLRLPVKSLVRFRSVCKSWRVLISAPHFVDRHLRRVVSGRNEARRNLLLPGNRLRSIDYGKLLEYFMTGDLNFDYPVLLFRNIRELLISETDVEVGLIDWPESIVPNLNSVQIYGSCNGLVCLEFDYVNVLLWNPYTGESRMLPEPNVCNGAEFYGFGYDVRSGDYKAVRGGKNVEDETVVEVFTLRSGSWRKCCIDYVLEGQGFVLHGALHWVALDCNRIFGAKIVSFDLGDEKFKEVLQCPDPLAGCGEWYCSVGIGVVEDCLTVCIEPSEGDLRIWMMEKYGVTWTRVASIAREALPKEFRLRSRPLSISKNGEVLLNLDRNVLALYSSEVRRFKAVVLTHENVSFDTAVYAESLVSPVTGHLKELTWEQHVTRRHMNTNRSKLLLPIHPFYSVDYEALLKHFDKVAHLGRDYFGYPIVHIQNLSQLISGVVPIREFDCPVMVPKFNVQIYGSCNGLVCLEVGNHKIVLWNPCTGDSKLLPEATHFNHYRGARYFGFGYDSMDRDYKVIRGYNGYAGQDEAKFEVFTLKTGSWRQDCGSLGAEGQGCLVNDALHWVRHGYDEDMGEINDSKIVSFNLREENFQEVSVPNLPPLSEYYRSVEIGELGGCLCICFEPVDIGLRIWVMKEYGVKDSWTEVLKISEEVIPQIWKLLSRPLAILDNGEVLLNLHRNVLALYNTKRNIIRTVAKTHEDQLLSTAIYVETLVSPATGCGVGM